MRHERSTEVQDVILEAPDQDGQNQATLKRDISLALIEGVEEAARQPERAQIDTLSIARPTRDTLSTSRNLHRVNNSHPPQRSEQTDPLHARHERRGQRTRADTVEQTVYHRISSEFNLSTHR